MSTQRASRRQRARKGAAGATHPGLPSLHNGMQGLNHLAGNQAMAAVLARRQPKGAWRSAQDSEAPAGEEELAALRLKLDEFEKLMKELERARDGGRGGYGRLQEWILELIAALHGALEATEDYDGGLQDLLDDLERLPRDPGEHRLEVLTGLAARLQADGEKAFGHLSKQLPSPGSPQRKGLRAGTVAQGLVQALKREAAKAKREAETDVAPSTPLAAGAGALALRRPRRRKRKVL